MVSRWPEASLTDKVNGGIFRPLVLFPGAAQAAAEGDGRVNWSGLATALRASKARLAADMHRLLAVEVAQQRVSAGEVADWGTDDLNLRTLTRAMRVEHIQPRGATNGVWSPEDEPAVRQP